MNFPNGATSFHTIQSAVGRNNKTKHLQGSQLGNFTNIPDGFGSWGDEKIPYVPKTVSSLFDHTLTDSDRHTNPQRPGSGQLFPRGKQWSPSNT